MSEIVISGFSGKFPECDNVEELEEKLYNGIDMVVEDDRRWPIGIYGLPTRNGKLKDLSCFDAIFFGISPKHADNMDPQLRILIENVYEAIVDAGYNPKELKGKNIGVFIGQTNSESLDLLSQKNEEGMSGYVITGASRFMTANRVSFTFDFRGMSLSIDTACSSTLVAFHLAVRALESGEIDGAIVGGVSLLLAPITSVMYNSLNLLSKDGNCKSFDSTGKGYVRSETVGALFLQRKTHARRAYARILGTGINADGYDEMGISYPVSERQEALIQEVLQRSKITPNDVIYFEAHGTGTKVGDPNEVNAIHRLFCQGVERSTPLLLGSIKSNIGHGEAAASIGQLAKVILAMERGIIPANLHYDEPNPEILGLTDGTIKVVDRNLPWNGGVVSINSFGFGGTNAHVILKSNPKDKTRVTSHEGIPNLIVCSGRTEEAVIYLLNKVNQLKDDNEFLSLIREIYKINTPGHVFRGYQLDGNSSGPVVVEAPSKKQIWYIFSGMGSQWMGTARALLPLKPFADAIAKCAEVLNSVGIDLMDMISKDSPLNAANSLICIASVQVGLVDLLSALGVTPDHIVGHSAGELGCAYADGGYTAEETVMIAHIRGQSLKTCTSTGGAMAAISGLTWEEVQSRLPNGIYAACHNTHNNVSISGNGIAIKKFLEDLAAEGITSRLIDCSGFAFHCPDIAPAALAFKEAICKMGLTVKKRTPKWISTSALPSSSEQEASFNSPEYHAFNVLNPVRFKEAIDLIPDGSIIVEVAPHSLLSGLLRQSVPNSTIITLTNKNVPNGLSLLLKELGKLYNNGVALDLKKLYPSVVYPVSRGTPMISNLVKWDHTTKWKVASVSEKSTNSGQYQFEVDTKNEEMQFLKGHVINGRILFPLTGYLVLVWKAFAEKQRTKYNELPVVLSDIQSSGVTVLPAEGSLKLSVNIFESGKFEVVNDGSTIVMTGHVTKMEEDSNSKSAVSDDDSQSTGLLDTLGDDVYKLMRLRRYEYSGLFRGIKSIDIEGNICRLQWADNWITFIDSMLQFDVFGADSRKLYVPVSVNRITINPQEHAKSVENYSEILARSFKNIATIQSGGVEIQNVRYSELRGKEQKRGRIVLERREFVPYLSNEIMTFNDAIKCSVEIIVENSRSRSRINIREFACAEKQLISPLLCDALEEERLVTADIVISSQTEIDLPEYYSKMINVHISDYKDFEFKEDVIVVTNLGGNKGLCKNLLPNLKPNTFIMCFEDEPLHLSTPYELIAKFPSYKRTLFLYRKTDEERKDPSLMVIDETNFAWVQQLKNWIINNQSTRKSLVLISSEAGISGLIGFVKCLRLEDLGNSIRLMLLPSDQLSANDLVLSQAKKDLFINVLKNGVWGSYRHLKLHSSQTPDSMNPPQVLTPQACVDLNVEGDLSSLHLVNSPLWIPCKTDISSTLKLCTVDFASLNFHDLMIATGKLIIDNPPERFSKQDTALGLEFVGRSSSGNKVMGLLETTGLATSVIADEKFLWDIPDDWSLEQASTIPMAYSTAYYALIVRGRLTNGETILIHSGCSTVGLAAISIALNRGCEVFATVEFENKKDFLLASFSGLKRSNIGNSRSPTFEKMVLDKTQGRGVDLVLNSLTGDLLNASIRCLAATGRFLELGKFDLFLDSPLGRSIYLKNASFHVISFDALLESKFDGPIKDEIFSLVKCGISTGEVKPLPLTVFQRDQLEEAFRLVEDGNYIGKVVLKMRSEEEQLSSTANRELIPAVNKSYMDPKKSYIIVGGLGGFGLELTDWLIARGATKVVLTSRYGATTGYQKLCLRRWNREEMRVMVCITDCSTEDGAKEIINEAIKLGAVGAIYNLAGILQDGFFLDSQNEDTFEKICSAKIRGTFWLDSLSRQMCPHLDSFVTFSSVTSGRGNPGQTNYGYANSAMEGLCDKRLADGYPALAIQWGAIGDVGMVERFLQVRDNVKIAGTWPQKIASCLETLDFFLTLSDNKLKSSKHQSSNRSAVVSSMIATVKGIKTMPIDSTSESTITSRIADILGINDVTKMGAVTLTELGMDSLMAVEIKEQLEIHCEIKMLPEEVRNLTFVQLQEMSSTRLNP